MTWLPWYSLDSTFIFLVICGSIGLSAQQSALAVGELYKI